MNGSNLARLYLMRSLAISRKVIRRLEDTVKAGRCIIEGCNAPCSSRGLCDKHRQRFYHELRKLESAQQLQFEENAIREGLILAPGEQERLRREDTNPFRRAAVS